MSAPERASRPRWLLPAAAVPVAAAAVQMVPSVVSLGQWAPIRVLPGGWCRWRGPDRGGVALTFDDGPDPATTPLVLDRLEDLDVRATFFCLGSQVGRHPDLVAEAHGRGHEVELHGHRHDHHFVRTPGWIRRDLERGRAALEAAGVAPRWFRPPFGQATGPTLFEARRQGLRVVLWSAWGREWDEPDSAAVARRVIGGLGGGVVVLLHDSDGDGLSPAGSCARALDALPSIVDAIRSTGLRTQTLDELVA